MNQQKQINLVRCIYRQVFNDYAGDLLINKAIELFTNPTKNTDENFCSLHYALSRNVSNVQPSITSLAGGCYGPESFEDYFRILVAITYNFCYRQQWYGKYCCLQECVRDTDLVHPWLDIDYEDNIPDGIVKEIAEELYPNERYRIVCNQSAPNRKYHVHFYDKVEVKQDVVTRVKQLQVERTDLAKYIDSCMTGCRLLYNIKPGKRQSIYAPSSTDTPLLVLADLMLCMVKVPWSFLQIPNPSGQLLLTKNKLIDGDPQAYKAFLTKQKHDAIQRKKEEAREAHGQNLQWNNYPEEVREEIHSILAQYGDFEYHENDRGVRLTSQGSFECPACNDTHSKDNAALFLRPNSISFYCFNTRRSKVIKTFSCSSEEVEQQNIEATNQQVEIDVSGPLMPPKDHPQYEAKAQEYYDYYNPPVAVLDIEFDSGSEDESSDEEDIYENELQIERCGPVENNAVVNHIPANDPWWEKQARYFRKQTPQEIAEEKERARKLERKVNGLTYLRDDVKDEVSLPKIKAITQCNKHLQIKEVTDTMLIQSGLGSGKTHFALNILQKALQKDKSTSVIFVTCRRSLAPSIESRMKEVGIEATNYLNGRYDGQIQICQVESLHNLSRAKYDYVFIDEITSVTMQFSSSTNGENVQKNYAVFAALIQLGKTVIGMDGNITQRAQWILQVNGRKEVALHVNTYKNQTGKLIRVRTDFEAVTGNMEKDMRDGKKIVIVSASKTRAKLLFEKLKKLGKTALVTADTSDQSRYRDAKNWSELDCLIYSPTITVGVDFSKEHFDCKYIIAPDNGRGCVARDLVQMAARVRHVTNTEVTLFIPQRYEKQRLPTTIDACKKDIQRTINCNCYNAVENMVETMMKKNIARRFTNLTILPEGNIVHQLKVDDLTELQLRNMVEQHISEQFYEGLLQFYFQQQGYTYNTDLVDINEKWSDNFKQEVKELKTKVKQGHQQAVLEQNEKTDEELEQCLQRQKRNIASADDKIGASVYFVRKDFREPLGLDIIHIIENHEQFLNSRFVRDIISYDSRTRNRLLRLPMDKTVERTPQINELNSMVAKFTAVAMILRQLDLTVPDLITAQEKQLPLERIEELHSWLATKHRRSNETMLQHISRPFNKDRSKLQKEARYSILFLNSILGRYACSLVVKRKQVRQNGKRKYVPEGLTFKCNVNEKMLDNMKPKDWTFWYYE